MNVVSERLNCSASACIVAVSRPRPSSNTARGLPASGDSANTLTIRYAYVAMSFLQAIAGAPARERAIDIAGERAESRVGDVVGARHQRFTGAGKIARDRLRVHRIVVPFEQLGDERVEFAAGRGVAPSLEHFLPMDGREMRETRGKLVRRSDEMRVLVPSASRRAAASPCRGARTTIRASSRAALRAPAALPILRLSDSTNTGRAGSSVASAAASALSNAFCDGCGSSGRSPSSEPRCRASPSRSSVCAPSAASAARSRHLPEPVSPQITR